MIKEVVPSLRRQPAKTLRRVEAGFFSFRGHAHISILDGDLADQLTDALIAADIPQSAVLTVQELSGPEWDPTYTDVPYDCLGWVDNYAQIDHVDSSVQVNDRKVYVLCSTLAVVPTTANTLTISGSTYGIIAIQRDPAGTAWVLQCRT
ncbi:MULTISPECIES: hypothetical protein [Rhodopseudomonas]|uniref:Uncharacterized protein n=1 Tax=Rhodopseudomonas palustris TaxID=1076 RepID=A0A0D7E9A7_RHOPL|nr:MULTISPECIES: hypothetical protein [Rhodopseudomonas]KIZ37085.1 hypothetical protein OO17_23995 [Rhodopseudomonas palustris]MDF3811283.1 hypothetical protein [Rhodopseudomonas sp. BAL398]WOK18608.1 hypothetical protein RBJ75_03505 [Rhodopseudomonas sp. BAL398]